MRKKIVAESQKSELQISKLRILLAILAADSFHQDREPKCFVSRKHMMFLDDVIYQIGCRLLLGKIALGVRN